MVEHLAESAAEGNRHLACLAQAAKALHGERDLNRAIAWAIEAISDICATASVALCLTPGHGSPSWVMHQRSTIDFSALGDPRTNKSLRPATQGASRMMIDDVRAVEAELTPTNPVRRLVREGRLLLVPVMADDGISQGALFVADAGPGAFADDDIEAIEALCAHLAIAIANQVILSRFAEVEARGKEVVHQLQEAVRPPVPVVPMTELGVHYVAADPSAPTGGDLYDWALLPNGDLHIAVVDVMGKGVEATKHALAVTHSLRILAIEGCPLGDLIARADALVTAQNPELVATVLTGRYSPDTGHLVLAGAGHPPALVVSKGQVREVAAPGIPIGWPGAASHGTVEVDLERSDTLILYTDGLIEAHKDILRGLDDLAYAASTTSTYPARAQARVLVERQLANAARQDDSLALVLRRRAPVDMGTRPALGPFAHQFSPNPAAVPLARHLFKDWLERVPVDPDSADVLLLVASELCSNAVRHATGQPGSVALRAWTVDDAVTVEVEDDGGLLEWPPIIVDGELPDPEAERGRGLFLVSELADEVTNEVNGGRSVVRIVKRAVVGYEPDAPLPTTAAN